MCESHIGHNGSFVHFRSISRLRGLNEVEESLRLAARRSLDRMLEMASGTIGKGDWGRIR